MMYCVLETKKLLETDIAIDFYHSSLPLRGHAQHMAIFNHLFNETGPWFVRSAKNSDFVCHTSKCKHQPQVNLD